MTTMLHHKRSEHQCSYGCCRTLMPTKRTRWNGMLRRREERAWRAEVAS